MLLMKLPVVASDRGTLPEVLDDIAYFINPNGTADIADGLAYMLRDQECAD